MSRLERLALAAYQAFYGERAVSLGGGAVAFRVNEAPKAPMLNRVAGLGVEEPATEAVLDAGLQALAGTTHYVGVAPGARPRELVGWLDARGLEPGLGWMQFRRGLDDLPRTTTELDLIEVDRSTAPAFAHIVRVAYALPIGVEPFLARITDTGWRAWLALADHAPVATGALFAQGDGAYLSFAGSLPEHRRRGAQSALLAARIQRARELGCRWVATETGETRPDQPSHSYRNILRAGFTEQFVIANWRNDAARRGPSGATTGSEDDDR